MTVEIYDVKEPVYTATGNVECIVYSNHDFSPFGYTAASYDPEEHGKLIWKNLMDGVYGPIAPYVPPK